MKLDTISYPWSEEKKTSRRLNVKANKPFMLMHHPQNWQMVYVSQEDKRKKDKPLLVPKFSLLRMSAGINNVQLGGTKLQVNKAIADAQDRGFTMIDPEKYDYIRIYPARGGSFYCDAFTSFEQIGTSLINNFDHDAYNDFRKKLVYDGVISLPHVHFIRILENDNRKIITKYSQLLHNPNHEAKYNLALQYDKDLKYCIKQIQELGREYYV